MPAMKIDEYKKLSRKGCNKYGAKSVGKHASKKEHYRSAALQMMQRAGIIANLREQVTYELIPAQYKEINGKKKCIEDRKSTRLNSSHANISYAVFCLKKKKIKYHKILI